MIVGDEAFPLYTYLMKPFAARTLNEKRVMYNYRHSRARRTVECAFGILASKFEVFKQPMRVEPDNAILITKAAVSLHNFIHRRDGHIVDRTFSIAYEIRDNIVADGLQPLALNAARGKGTNDAMKVQEPLSNFFSDPSGSVKW